MTGVWRERRGVPGVPSAALLKLNRRTLPNILVIGGASHERAAVVQSLHRGSVLAASALVAVDGRRDAMALEQALHFWLGHASSEPELRCHRGTLFVDDVAALPHALQRLLQRLARRMVGIPAQVRCGPGPARLAAGCALEPATEVAHGRLLADLHDSLEKLCVQLVPVPVRRPSRLRDSVRAPAAGLPASGLHAMSVASVG